jgi:hypothetical protein
VGDSARDRAERRIERAREMYDRHGHVFHVLWVAVAVVIVLAGVVMTVFPGPAAVVVPFGMAMLAVVFGWARKLLLGGVDHGADAVEYVRDTSTLAKVLAVAAVAAIAGGILAWFLL